MNQFRIQRIIFQNISVAYLASKLSNPEETTKKELFKEIASKIVRFSQLLTRSQPGLLGAAMQDWPGGGDAQARRCSLCLSLHRDLAEAQVPASAKIYCAVLHGSHERPQGRG